ncbi:MAG TPA: hypothetical protein VJ022_08535 [Anaerolineales bacterium]|nr:hypothetical protein [Anaerolineales bacterium]
MLSNTSRLLTYGNAFLYAVLGGFLFFMPEGLAPVFAWKVTPFMTMTIGGWCLGNAWLAFFAARRWDWQRVYTAILYLWVFGAGELFVLYLFRGKLVLAHPVAWLYLTTLIVNVVAALIGLFDLLRIRPALESSGPRTNSLQYTGLISFIVFVGFLGYYGCTAQIGAPGTNGGIFPEIMSLFTLRSFGVFYLSLSVGAVPLLWDRNLKPFLNYGFLAFGLILFITTAAFMYIRLFDFSARPAGLAYFGAYISVGIVFLIYFRAYGTGKV